MRLVRFISKADATKFTGPISGRNCCAAFINATLPAAGKLLGKWSGADVELNWRVVYRLAELAYRCTLCRRCATVCSVGVDNALLSRELRKLFSQEMGIAPEGVHKSGSVQHLKTGSSTGMSPAAFLNTIEFIEELIEEKTGRHIKIPVDKKNADIMLIHNAGEFMSWPENPAAFAILFDAAGINWTLSSEAMGYEGVNYGVWYDDVQFARVAVAQVRAAKKLGVKKIVVGECGHATKALITIADRLLVGDLAIPRESCLPLLESFVTNGAIKFDPSRNNFPVTLHDPCNIGASDGYYFTAAKYYSACCSAGKIQGNAECGYTELLLRRRQRICNNELAEFCRSGATRFAAGPRQDRSWRPLTIASTLRFRNITVLPVRTARVQHGTLCRSISVLRKSIISFTADWWN